MQTKSTSQQVNENQMNELFQSRRKALAGFAAVVGTVLVGRKLHAQEQPVCPDPVKPIQVVESEISNNHAHDFAIEFSQLLKGLGQPFDIQGDSGHPHAITIENQHVISLLKGETVMIVSTKVAGHTHAVTLKLVEVPPQG
jgi:hypothetical protein